MSDLADALKNAAAPAPTAAPTNGPSLADVLKGATPASAPAVPAPDAGPQATGLGSYLPDWMTKPIATGSVADTARVAGNAFGLYDQVAAHLKTGDYVQPQEDAYAANLKAERAKTEAASGRLGGAGNFIANAAGYAPFSALGVAGGTADALGVAAPITRTLVGNMVEGGVGGGLSAEGRGENVEGGVGKGIAGGAVATPVSGVGNFVGRNLFTLAGRGLGLLSNPGEVTAATEAASKDAFSTAGQYKFNPNDTTGAYTAAKASLQPSQRADLSDGMNSKFNGHLKDFSSANSVDADNLNGYARGIQNAVRTDGDGVLAARIKDNLNGVMGTATPTSGQPAGEALMQIEKARQAAQQAIMAKGLQGASTELKSQYVSPGQWAQQQSQFYKPGSDQNNTLSGIVRASGGGGALPSGYGAAHVAGEGLEAALAAAGMPSAGIMAGVGTQALKPLLGGTMKWFKQKSLLGKLADAYPSLTGEQVTAQPKAGDLIRSAIESKAATGY